MAASQVMTLGRRSTGRPSSVESISVSEGTTATPPSPQLARDQAAGLVRREHAEGVGAADAPERGPHGRHQVGAAHVVALDQVGHNLGVGLGAEPVPVSLELGAELEVVLENAVVNDYQTPGAVRVWMGIGVGRAPVGGPAGGAQARP